MKWRHNLVSGEKGAVSAAGTDFLRQNGELSLLVTERPARRVHRLSFSPDGKIMEVQPLLLENRYEVLLSHDQGYILTGYESPQTVLTGFMPDHRQAWRLALPETDSPRWSLANGGEPGRLLLFYSSCNPYDAHKRAVTAALDLNSPEEPPAILFTVPEEDYGQALTALPLPDGLVVYAKNRGAGVVWYRLDFQGQALADGSLAVHPHSRWAVPLAAAPLSQGDFLLAGYQETIPGQRTPWFGQFDETLNILNGFNPPVEQGEPAVTRLFPEPDGGCLALCPPWRVFKLSSMGLITHIWDVPKDLRRNALADLAPAEYGGCFIAGVSCRQGETGKAAWLARIGLDEFEEITGR